MSETEKKNKKAKNKRQLYKVVDTAGEVAKTVGPWLGAIVVGFFFHKKSGGGHSKKA